MSNLAVMGSSSNTLGGSGTIIRLCRIKKGEGDGKENVTLKL